MSNKMNLSEIVLLNLLSDSLFSISHSYSDNTDWNAVLDEAQKQAVAGLIYDRLPDSARPAEQQILLEAQYVQYMCAEEDLLRLLSDQHIPAVILKGSAAAVYYPHPSKRSFGDIDVLVPVQEYEKAKRLLSSSGYRQQFEDTGDRHCDYIKDGIPIELHHRFSFDDLDIENYIIEGFKKPDQGSIEGHEFPMLPKLANGLVLLAHMRHHLQSGMGLRQMIDWMMYCDKVLDDTFWQKEFMIACDKTGMTTLAVTATAMCQKYLGLKKTITWCKGADEALCDMLMSSLFSSGNFGMKNGKGSKVEYIVSQLREEGLFHRLQRAGEHNWEKYHTHHWLKPLCWSYQIFRYMKQGITTNRRSGLTKDFYRGNKRYNLLKKIKIE